MVAALGLRPGERVLDVGCGTGRHAWELAGRGIEVHGIDISHRFVDIARSRGSDAPDPARRGLGSSATFERGDARAMAFDSEFDAVICLCQGAFGMMTAAGDDAAVVAGMARALRPGGRLALSAFNAYFAVKYHDDASFDAGSGVSHEVTEIRSESGEVDQCRPVDRLLHAPRAAVAAGCGRVRRRLDLQCRTGTLRIGSAHHRVPRVPRHRPSRLKSRGFRSLSDRKPQDFGSGGGPSPFGLVTATMVGRVTAVMCRSTYSPVRFESSPSLVRHRNHLRVSREPDGNLRRRGSLHPPRDHLR